MGYSSPANPSVFVSIVPSVTSFRAVVERVSGDSTIFSGEDVRLRCSIPDAHRSNWNYLWFRGSELLPQSGEQLVLWKVKIKDGGKIYCQGVRDTVVGNIYTLQSLPMELNVDGKILFIFIIKNLLDLHIQPHSSLFPFFPLTSKIGNGQ